MLNARHNNDKHNGPGLSGSTVPQLTRLFSPPLPCYCLHTVHSVALCPFVSELRVAIVLLEAVAACLFVALLCRVQRVHGTCGLFVYLPHN